MPSPSPIIENSHWGMTVQGGGGGEVAREPPPTLDWWVHIITTDSHPIVQMEKHEQPLVEGKPQWMGKDLSDGEEGPKWQWKAGK